MKDKELRKLIGNRAKQRRVELGLNQPYVAEKMGVAERGDGEIRNRLFKRLTAADVKGV